MDYLKKFAFILTAVFALAACADDDQGRYDDDSPKPLPECADAINTDSFVRLPTDPYTLDTAWREGTKLYVTVSYSGGCEEHGFSLDYMHSPASVYPPQVNLSLYHDANGDMCEAYLTETRCFDLTPICDDKGGSGVFDLLINGRKMRYICGGETAN